MIMAPDLDSARPITDGEIAIINLESARRRSWSKFFENPTRDKVAETVVEHEQLTLQFAGDVFALDRVELLAAQLVQADAASARAMLIRAQVASMAHRFFEAKQYLVQAEIGGAPTADVDRLRLNIDQACGSNLDNVLDARRKLADESHGLQDLMALASLLADMRDFSGADRTYRDALRAYRDVSPFPLASVYFHLGLLWGELVSEPDKSHTAQWYQRAIDVVPSYAKARIHLAEIYASHGRLSEAEALLIPAASGGDPEAHWRLSDVIAAEGNSRDSERHMEVARAGFDLLLERHLLAFADHGAEFYAGSGNDPRRALELACINVGNRPTLRAFEQAHDIALNAADPDAASELLTQAAMRWKSTTAFRSSRLAHRSPERREGAAA